MEHTQSGDQSHLFRPLTPEEQLEFLLNEEDAGVWFTEVTGRLLSHFRHNTTVWPRIAQAANGKFIPTKRLEEFVDSFCEENGGSVSDGEVAECIAWRKRWEKPRTLKEIDDNEDEWAIRELLPYGAVFLTGPPKAAKSTMAMNIAIAKASGADYLGFSSGDPGNVLFLSLEDQKKTLRRRMDQLEVLDDDLVNENLDVAFDAPHIGDSLINRLNTWRTYVPNPSLVILDVFASVSGQRKNNANAYQADYELVAMLQQWGLKYDVCVLILHHTNKAGYTDPFDKMLGTSGLRGATMANLVLLPDNDDEDDVCSAKLYLESKIGRKMLLRLKFEYPRWRIDHHAMEMSDERRDIYELLYESPSALSPAEIARTLGKNAGAIRRLVRKMVADNQIRDIGQKYTLFDYAFTSEGGISSESVTLSNNNNKFNKIDSYPDRSHPRSQGGNVTHGGTGGVTGQSNAQVSDKEGGIHIVTDILKTPPRDQMCDRCGGYLVHDKKGAVCVSCRSRV